MSDDVAVRPELPPLEAWMKATGRSPIAVAYAARVSLATVDRARKGRRVSYPVARRLVAASGGALKLEALLAGVTAPGSALALDAAPAGEAP